MTCAPLTSYNCLRLPWITGNTGIRGNEIAERLASQETSMVSAGPELLVGILRCSAETAIDEWIQREHPRCWLLLIDGLDCSGLRI